MSDRKSVKYFWTSLIAFQATWLAWKWLAMSSIWLDGWWSYATELLFFQLAVVVVELVLWSIAVWIFLKWIKREYWLSITTTVGVLLFTLLNFYAALMLLASTFGQFTSDTSFFDMMYAVVTFANGNQSVSEVVANNEWIFLTISILSYLMIAIVISLMITSFSRRNS